MKETKTLLSTLWIFVMFNYLYCDVMSLMDPPLLKQYLAGNAGGMTINAGFLLGAAILMEIPMAMVLLSIVLKGSALRWANVAAGLVMTLVQIFSLTVGGTAPSVYYWFFSVVEVSCTAFIAWYACTKLKPGAKTAV
jgi:hypothetical protein